ncbi:MAG: lysylphosphatidylglycerol synthase domain-containing protein [Gaiellaceae bacterium]
MTAPATDRGEHAVSAQGSWQPALLAAAEPGRRNRRTIDGVVLAAGAIVTGLAAVIASSAHAQDEDVAEGLITVLGWAEVLWRFVFVSALALALVIVAVVLVRRRWLLARDLAAALLLLVGLGIVLGRIVESDWFPLEPHLLSHWGFPELRLAAATAVIVVAGPELIQPVRRLATWLVPLAALGTVALGAALPSGVLGGLALGLGAAALVRLAFGTAAAVPPAEQVRSALATLGVNVNDLRIAERQRVGAAEFVGHDANGPLNVRVLGRDAQDTQRLARRWRLLAYRDPPQSAPVGRREQVEHEAVATLMAAQAGVRVPEVVMVGLGPDGDALLVTREPDVAPLESSSPDQVSDETLEELWRQVARLHAAGISHGRLNASNVLVVDDGPMLIDLSAATLGAPQSSLDIDVAELLVACAILVGPERALGKAVAAGWGDAVARVLPYLQRAALTPHLRDLARTHEVGLKDLRAAAAEAAGMEKPPEIAPLRRVRPKDLLLTAAVIFAAYVLITKLADIGFGTIADELAKAELAWVVVALILAQASFIGSGISVRGAVAAPLPLLPCVLLQSAMKFVNLTVPSSAGRIGMNLRFLQEMGVPRAQAVAAGFVDDVSETMVQVALLLLTLPFVQANVDTSQFSGAGPNTRLIAAIALALVVAIVAVLAVPKLRAKVVPGVRSAFSSLWSVARNRRKRIELFGGNIGSELLYALALGATCLAYGVDLNLAQLVFVNTAASVLSSLIPVPGGIGAAEAALSAGLITMGVDESTALAVAITQRLCTFYLPPIWGYFSLQWLSRKGYV